MSDYNQSSIYVHGSYLYWINEYNRPEWFTWEKTKNKIFHIHMEQKPSVVTKDTGNTNLVCSRCRKVLAPIVKLSFLLHENKHG